MALRNITRGATDLVELILDRALHALDPTVDSPVIIHGDTGGRSAVDMQTVLTRHVEVWQRSYLVTCCFDSHGHRTALNGGAISRLDG